MKSEQPKIFDAPEIDLPDGTKLVSGAIAGLDFRLVAINGKSYIIEPPTIHKIAGACYFMDDLGNGESIKELISGLKNMESLAKALSWFIQGDDGLTEELMQAQFSEIIDGLELAFSMVDAGNFTRLSALLRSARTMIAKQK